MVLNIKLLFRLLIQLINNYQHISSLIINYNNTICINNFLYIILLNYLGILVILLYYLLQYHM